MAQTTFSGPLASGDRPAGAPGGPNIGQAYLAQTAVINFNNTLVQNATFNVPTNSQIVDFYVDVLTVFDSATSATLSAGTASGGTQYLSAINVKTAARRPNAFSNTQLAAMANVGTNRTVVATVTSVGQPTAGQVRVTLLYVQTTADD